MVHASFKFFCHALAKSDSAESVAKAMNAVAEIIAERSLLGDDIRNHLGYLEGVLETGGMDKQPDDVLGDSRVVEAAVSWLAMSGLRDRAIQILVLGGQVKRVITAGFENSFSSNIRAALLTCDYPERFEEAMALSERIKFKFAPSDLASYARNMADVEAFEIARDKFVAAGGQLGDGAIKTAGLLNESNRPLWGYWAARGGCFDASDLATMLQRRSQPVEELCAFVTETNVSSAVLADYFNAILGRFDESDIAGGNSHIEMCIRSILAHRNFDFWFLGKKTMKIVVRQHPHELLPITGAEWLTPPIVGSLAANIYGEWRENSSEITPKAFAWLQLLWQRGVDWTPIERNQRIRDAMGVVFGQPGPGSSL